MSSQCVIVHGNEGYLPPARTLLFAFICFSIFSCETPAMAKETWTISQTIQTESGAEQEPRTRILVYEVTDYASSIISDEESVFVDYEDMCLYRFDRIASVCESFPFDMPESMDKDSVVAANLRKLMAEIVVKNNGKEQRINSINCSGKDVLFGAGLLRMKTVAPITVQYMGQSFGEAIGEYWVSLSMVPWRLFEEKIVKRQAAFATNPLLRHIDPLGLIESLNGFPVQGSKRSKEQRIDSVLVSGPISSTSPLSLPDECQRDINNDCER